jgi:DNA adenine methylase
VSYYCSPLRYPGGKNCIFKFVSELFYENDLIGMNYAEPYAGGAGLALKLLIRQYVDKIYINDLDRSIFSFWKEITENSDAFCAWISSLEVSVANWNKYREIQNNKSSASLCELAKSTFFLNRTNVSGVLKGGVIGGLSQKGKYKIDARFNKKDLIDRISIIASYSSRIKVTNLDGVEFLNWLCKEVKDVFIYLDPPYVNKGASLYMNFFSKADHSKLAKRVKKIKKHWMTSYDNDDFILDLYEDKERLKYQLSQSASNRVGDEVLIFSDRIEFSKSMQLLKSAERVG